MRELSERELLARVDERSMQAFHAVGQLMVEVAQCREDVREVRGMLARLEGGLSQRVASMREKLTSVPDVEAVEEIVEHHHHRQDAEKYRRQREFREKLLVAVLSAIAAGIVVPWVLAILHH